MKDRELDSYYSNFLSLFLHPGWLQLLQELGTTEQQLSEIRSIRDGQDLVFRQGQLEAITTILNFEESVRKTIETIEEDENAL